MEENLEYETAYKPGLRWLIFAEKNERFPYRLFIEEEPGRFQHLRIQDK